ncbi:NUDIX domain-containing protein [Staphylococcus gallinarum]|jgi:predicted NUDIX family phosphoesterase|uniref:DNA mismatch repair protein MutT n=2 Tax=Staphylococcus gallinarum TaxID=1293 RepID=A0ABQ0Y1U6_STAGA|nr:NUDIX domain-containing protein [Staphylococcus gallinarum]KIR11654.1 DNA mismatch repair protein MutT [Staphylococcus gallinarum]MBU7216884.1 NUDIX domain-containing protein [Staphylococcus gallinarum]MCD8786974.1 NUDIX domain-containing protein [Staphylococcus gallinarum]MCD8793809.1 NUDIX domain-containing protein [Staphylococcus gallinarum]MCD8819935.1 NUDIX domain-containing protein [Staphylococcus gallinarum]
MSKFDEMITVVPRSTLFNEEKNKFNGFLDKNSVKGQEIFDTLTKYEVKRRGDMEEDPTYKQLISYCILENERDEILVYERLSGGGEARLHGQSSIGVGGHMNDVKGADSINEVLRVNAQRELEEEVGLSAQKSQNLAYIGFINDDTNEVGEVHMGVVFKINVNSSDVEAKETDTLRIKWMDQAKIDNYDDFETWSALILQALK